MSVRILLTVNRLVIGLKTPQESHRDKSVLT